MAGQRDAGRPRRGPGGRLADALAVRLDGRLGGRLVGRPGGRPERLTDYVPEGVPAVPPADLVTMGRWSYSRPHVLWYPGDTGRVRIGAFCSLNQSVRVFAGGAHRADWVTTYGLRVRMRLPGAFQDGATTGRGDVVLGSDVHVGWEAVILSGVTVGHGAVVGARAVVTRDVPPYAVVVGNPARVVRHRFGEAERAALLRVAWWDWDDDRVRAEVDALSSAEVGAFLRRHDDRYAADHPG